MSGLLRRSVATQHFRQSVFLFDRAAVHGVDPFEPTISDLRTGREERFERRHEIPVPRAVFKPVTGVFEHGPSPPVR